MASGVYAKVDVSSASTWVTLVAPPSSGIKVTTVTLCNRTGSELLARLAIAANTSVTDSDVIEYDVAIPAKGVLERTGIVLDSSNGLQVYSSAAGLTAVAYGIDS